MSALAEQVSRYSQARERMGFAVTPIKRVKLASVPLSAPEAAKPSVAVAPLQFKPTRLHWTAIVNQVAEKHGVMVKDMMSYSRRRALVLARREAFYRMRTEIRVAGGPLSLPQIGKRFNRDHTTILWGIRSYCKANGLPMPPSLNDLRRSRRAG